VNAIKSIEDFLKITHQICLFAIIAISMISTFACNTSDVPIFSIPNLPRYYDVTLSTSAQTCVYQGESLVAENLSGELIQKGDYYYFILSSETDEINLIGEMCLDDQNEPDYFCLRARTRIRYQQYAQGCEMQFRIPSTEIPNLENWSNQEKTAIRKPLSCCNEDPNDDNGIRLEIERDPLDPSIVLGLSSAFKAGVFINQYLDTSTVSDQCLSHYACELQMGLKAISQEE
jgi:hypothetical protein